MESTLGQVTTIEREVTLTSTHAVYVCVSLMGGAGSQVHRRNLLSPAVFLGTHQHARRSPGKIFESRKVMSLLGIATTILTICDYLYPYHLWRYLLPHPSVTTFIIPNFGTT